MREALRLDGRVAIVTGAGRGLGRAYALLLAERGAAVVVNDTGGSKDGTGADTAVADGVVAEIVARGGTAVASTASVAEPDGARSIVATAVEQLGGVDILINNAGVLTPERFPEDGSDLFSRVIGVSLLGTFLVTQAAWPHLLESGHGRVLMTTSSAIFGSAPVPSYSCAKSGLIGLARSLGQLGAEHDIRVNLLCPTASTRLVGDPEIRRRAGINMTESPDQEGRGTPEQVAPLALVLVHDDCPVNGEILASNGLTIARIFLGVTAGFTGVADDPEALMETFATAMGTTDFHEPASGADYQRLRAERSLAH